jgi:hypothetical protein
MYIVTATSGACGDIVSTVIDSKDATLSPYGSIRFLPGRKILKYPDLDINKYSELIAEAATKYKSISSQYDRVYSQEYVIDTVNTYIGIKISNDMQFDWCLNRLKILYPTIEFNKEILLSGLVRVVEKADHLINLHDILTGNLISILSEFVEGDLNNELYQKWLALINEKFPYNFV